VLVEGLEAQK